MIKTLEMIIIIIAGILMLVLFFDSRNKSSKIEVLDIYKINSYEDAYALLKNPNISEEHKKQIRALIDFVDKLNKN